MFKKKSIIPTLLGLCAISLIAASSNITTSFSVFGAENYSWGHYLKVDATSSTPGSKEFWICCDNHQIVFSKPSGTIFERGKPSQTLISSWRDDGTNRYIDILKSKLKFAIFADVQLCGETASSNSAINLGNTANAPIALKNHLQFIKNQNINVVLMNGDITNQANENYYSYFEKILAEVYGSDESKYPEFVWNMGNHEWWWGTSEKESGDAVSMFKSHARIDSVNLIKESNVPYSINPSVNVPSYYKIINGIPFIVISAESSNGNVSSALKNEIDSWLLDIKKLDSVKNGGPIFVEYHYPLSMSMTHGQGSNTSICSTVENIFKDTPNAVIFTGDTHYPGISERAINQVNFTTINLGSSSYSRMVNESATICDDFDNVTSSSGSKIGDHMEDMIKYGEAYTPTIQIVDVCEDDTFRINRYFSQDNGTGKKVGKEWSFNKIKAKSDFTFTNDRFENKDASYKLYGKNGLSWNNTDKIEFGIDAKNNMTVLFPDVDQFHYCEHYQIKVNGSVLYDGVSNYYKYLDSKQNNYFYIKNVPSSSSYNVEVIAYDFYDNPSLNTLSSSVNNIAKCLDDIDYNLTHTYSDIQTKNNTTNIVDKSHSSVEYYYKGKYAYNYGAILNRVICPSALDVSKYISFDDSKNNAPVLKLKAKVTTNDNIKIGITYVVKNGGSEIWKTDFGVEYQKTVIANSSWQEFTWNLNDSFGTTKVTDISNLSLKIKSTNPSSNGYEMGLLIDDLDIVQDVVYRGSSFEAGKNKTLTFTATSISSGNVVVDILFTSSSLTKVALMIGNQTNWNAYFGYFDLYSTTKSGDYNGLTVTHLEDGYVRFDFALAQLTKTQSTLTYDSVDMVYLRDIWTSASGYIEINPSI